MLHKDPVAFDRSCVFGAYAETRLHIVAMLGQVKFAKEIMNQKPSLATKVDLPDPHRTPVAAINNVDMVALLLRRNAEMCLVPHRYGRNPLRIAAIHDAIKTLVAEIGDDVVINSIDVDGNIALHLAVLISNLKQCLVDPSQTSLQTGDLSLNLLKISFKTFYLRRRDHIKIGFMCGSSNVTGGNLLLMFPVSRGEGFEF
ncbi:hypothetical protein Cgig2_017433 [Carnegiea gigantea]|uniref:Ankyrin repeat protein n=1 Tax=Carnegiea gigantea TaxID=171969 RepID=A0A9Q1K4J2_9CARY|nr:hypothetical protein Cgig2_017433 [Carnegiea gigantea]